jgi:pyruvate dehydrogenase E1 component beta subunit
MATQQEAPTTTPPATRELNFLQAIAEAQAEEMRRDPNVIIYGQGIPHVYGTTPGFIEEFGPLRVRDAPLSEAVEVGAGIGAAMTGLRPIVDLTLSCFSYVAMDQIVHQAAMIRFMFGGQATLPLVIRSFYVYGVSTAAHHSDRPYPLFMHFPGLKIVVPTTPADTKGLLKTAIRDDSPVLFFQDGMLATRGPVPDGEHLVPFGVADVKRHGSDVTVVGISGGASQGLQAAEALESEGVDVEVVDPRTLRPLDTDTILASVRKTGRLVVVEPANRVCGAAAEIAAIVAENAIHDLRAPILRVTCEDTNVGYSPALLDIFPTPEKVATAVRRVMAESR